MNTVLLACLNNISKYSQVPIKNLSFNNDKVFFNTFCVYANLKYLNFQIPTCTINNKTINGFVNITVNLVKNSKKDLLGKDFEEECEVLQWLEYFLTYASCTNYIQVINQNLEVIYMQ